MSTYIFYLYMHLYPMCNILLPALIYSVMVALSAFSNFSFFTERLHFFFNLLENNLGEFYLHGILRNLKQGLESKLLTELNSRVMFTQRKRRLMR